MHTCSPNSLIRSWPLLVGACCVALALFVLGAQPFAVNLVPIPFDKLAHALVFGLLFVVLDHALRLPVAVVAAIPLLISLADELHQLSLPGRQPGIGDWLAGLLGILLAALLWRRQRARRANA